LTELEKLCQLQCTDEEIGAWFNVSTRTIERRRREPRFAEAMQRGKARGRISVRRMQMKLLEQGSASVAIWLGRQLLGQRDNTEERDLSAEDLSPKQLAGIFSRMSSAKMHEFLRECGVPEHLYADVEPNRILALPAPAAESDCES